MNDFNEQRVLITGGSKGIGFAIAEEFARNGHSLVLVARHQNELEQAADKIRNKYEIVIKVIAIDLARDEAPEKLFQQLNEESLEIDILVNNAGVGMTGKFANSDPSHLSQMLQLNMIALTHLTHLFLQPMLERKQGHILNIGSLVAYFTAAPNWTSYVASKHYVRAFTKGLARELKGSGVNVTLISPGATPTNFVATADATTMRVYQAPSKVSVNQIAKVAYKAYKNKSLSVTPGKLNKVLAFLGELPPRAIAFEALAFLSQKNVKAR